MQERRALYISPIGVREKNGMMQRQQQTLATLSEVYNGAVDVLSLGASPSELEGWLRQVTIRANVLRGPYASLAWLNAMCWYSGGVLLCNRLRCASRFRFPFRTPLPVAWLRRYNLIFCYYPWAYQLLRLDRAERKVVVDMGDVMSDRHERIGTRRWISLHHDDEWEVLQCKGQCIAISKDDALEFNRLYGVQLPVVPFSPPEWEELSGLCSGELPLRVGYLGAPSYQNEQVLHLLAEPEFVDCLTRAGIELVVAGGICETISPSVIESLRRQGVRVLGRINSTKNFYAQISTLVNPVGRSTGIKIKSLEALIAGRNLITTRWGADVSLHAAFGDQIISVDWPVNPRILGEITATTVKQIKPRNASAAISYAQRAARDLEIVLRR